MKIISVHTDPLPSEMAGSVFSLSTAAGIAKAGVETVLMMPSAGQTVGDALRYYDIEKPESLRIILPAPASFSLGPIRITYTPRFYRALLEKLRGEIKNADGIIVRTLRLAAYIVEMLPDIPIFYEMHNWYGNVDQKWEGARWMISDKKYKREKTLELVEKDTLPKMAGIITMREATAQLCREQYPSIPVQAASPGLDAALPFPESCTDPVVVYLGQLHLHKGLQLLFDAAQKAPDLRFMILGGGQWLPHWKEKADQNGLSDRVTFAGHIPKAKVPRYLARARVGVLPMLDCFYNRYLTSPLKIMEYYSAGLPVVTVNAPVTAEIVQHEQTGLLVPFDDPDALADGLNRLCQDDRLYDECRKNIEIQLPKWTWTNRGQKIRDFILQVNSKKSHPT